MSSDDASDDSEFDKEAEREKLREKYEEDQQDRENTRRMSELLLQGATMTGKHCDNCGDPIFRYDGQEFCPTCQHEGQQVQNAEQAQNQQAQNQQAQSTQTPADQGAETDRPDAEPTERRVADQSKTEASRSEKPEEPTADESESNESVSGEPRVEIDGIRVADEQPSSSSETASRHADHSNIRQPPSQQGGRDQRRRESRNYRNAGEAENSSRTGGRRSARTHDHAHTGERARDRGDDLATARESLVRKLTDLTLRAEETDDVARARELLAATREAAEALEALDRANR